MTIAVTILSVIILTLCLNGLIVGRKYRRQRKPLADVVVIKHETEIQGGKHPCINYISTPDVGYFTYSVDGDNVYREDVK